MCCLYQFELLVINYCHLLYINLFLHINLPYIVIYFVDHKFHGLLLLLSISMNWIKVDITFIVIRPSVDARLIFQWFHGLKITSSPRTKTGEDGKTLIVTTIILLERPLSKLNALRETALIISRCLRNDAVVDCGINIIVVIVPMSYMAWSIDAVWELI